jgi:DNA integrity scanning protein DisA with diadenylate cyclase activity
MVEVLPYWYRMLERVPKEEMLLSANLVETRGNLPPLV